MESYKILNEFISKLKSNEIEAANSIQSLITSNNFENNLKVIDRIFFENKLEKINSDNYADIIVFITNIHKIKSGEYNDFNIWSASKTHLRKSNPDLIERHDELNKTVGFPDNGNGLYKSFLGSKNLLSYIKDKFMNNAKSTNVLAKNNEIVKNETKKQEDLIQKKLFDINKFSDACKNSGLIYTDQLITRFVASLVTKPFVILSGLSGSGKTKLAQSFAQWICESNQQYCIVPVGADWTNREPILGYVNALDETQYIKPENGALTLILDANKNQDKPYFLILDEMNLSHVERYFADFLSIMESKEKFKLHNDSTSDKSGIPHELSWPKNLFVVGTVNIDETTYMFSPKVLDRANVIEFRVEEREIENFLKESKELTSIEGMGQSMGTSFVEIAKSNPKHKNLVNLNGELLSFFTELQRLGAEFGYRTGFEIQALFSKIDVIAPEYIDKEAEKIDIAIMQKLLPKLHGSRRKLIKTLETLAQKCLINNTENIFNEKGESLILSDNIKYRLSFEKISRMYKNVIDNGFTSYAEA